MRGDQGSLCTTITYDYVHTHMYRCSVVGVSELLSMPLQHRALVEAAGSRWINAKPSKYAKYIAYFLDKCGKYVLL